MHASPLDRLRTAMKFSLWAWAAYWPAMGLMLVLGGMRDPASVAIVLLALGAFALLLSSGALRATASRTMAEFLVERPLYVIGAVVLVVILGAAVPLLADIGLAAYSSLFLGSLVLVGLRLHAYVRSTGTGLVRSRGDQVAIVLALSAPGAFMVFVDAWLQGGLGNPPASVAAVNWVGLAYPALLLLASRPLREPLGLTLRRKGSAKRPAPVPVEA